MNIINKQLIKHVRKIEGFSVKLVLKLLDLDLCLDRLFRQQVEILVSKRYGLSYHGPFPKIPVDFPIKNLNQTSL